MFPKDITVMSFTRISEVRPEPDLYQDIEDVAQYIIKSIPYAGVGQS